jgi:hypothetical protein
MSENNHISFPALPGTVVGAEVDYIRREVRRLFKGERGQEDYWERSGDLDTTIPVSKLPHNLSNYHAVNHVPTEIVGSPSPEVND